MDLGTEVMGRAGHFFPVLEHAGERREADLGELASPEQRGANLGGRRCAGRNEKLVGPGDAVAFE